MKGGENPTQPVAVPWEPSRGVIGTVLDERYRIVERIGSGGMGTVYKAEHLRLGTDVAVKILRAELTDDAGMVERFMRESRAAASVRSEHVVSIVDSGILADGVPYFVMQLLLGSDLGALLKKCGRLSPTRAVNLAVDACRGLTAAHEQSLVHRDLKPANLFVTRGDDGRDLVKLLDFGVAKLSDANTTRPGALIGTARYMAPEQIGSDVPIGPATDLFALGVILYECVAGQVPFDGDTTERVIFKIMTSEAVPLAERVPGLPRGFSELVSRALSRDPAERFPSAAAFLEALAPFAGARRLLAYPTDLPGIEPVGAPDEQTLPDAVLSKPVEGARGVLRRGRTSIWLAALGGAGAALLGVLGVSALQAPSGAPVGDTELGGPLLESTVPMREEPKGSAAPERPAPAQSESLPSGLAPSSRAASAARPALVPAPKATPRKSPERAAAGGRSSRTLPSTSFDPENPYAR